MLRVMIVDDEPIIRRGIRNAIDWERHGMIMASEAGDGEEALMLAAMIKPDIVIADICMPGVDGLEMSEKLLSLLPDCKIVILTGHDKFEYAQRACSLGIMDYILKPTDADEILAVLTKVARSIQTQKGLLSRMEALQEEVRKHLPILRENLLNRLISGTITPRTLEENQEILPLTTHRGFFLAAVVDLDRYTGESASDGSQTLSEEYRGANPAMQHSAVEIREPLLQFAIKNFWMEAIEQPGYGHVCSDSFGRVTVLLKTDDGSAPERACLSRIEEIHRQLSTLFKSTMTIGIGRGYRDLSRVKHSYEEALEALEYRYIHGGNAVLYIDDVQGGYFEGRWNDSMRIEKEILTHVGKGDEGRLLALLHDYFTAIRCQPGTTPLWAKAKSLELISNVFLAAREAGVASEKAESGLETFYHRLHQSTSLEEAFSLAEESILYITGEIRLSLNTKTRKLIEKCREYIRQHFQEDLSVTDIADYLYVSPNYLSRLFKRETGEGCTEYINALRIEKAKDLLKNTLYLTYEISEIVGFKDPNYFSMRFKKHVGLSPTEYRDS